MKKKILGAMLVATAICSTTFAAEVPARGESSKDASFVSTEPEVVELSKSSEQKKIERQKKKEAEEARKKAEEERKRLEKERERKLKHSNDDMDEYRLKEEQVRRQVEREKKSDETVNLMPTQSQEYTFDQEFAIDGMATGMAHRVAHSLIPLSVEARFFAPHFDAKVHADSISYNGGTIGLKDQLGLGNDNAPELIVKFGGLQLDYIHVEGDGHSTLDNTLRFGSRNYVAGYELSSESEFDYIKLTYGHDIVSVMGNGVGWNAGIAGMHWKGKVTGLTSNGYRESRSKEYWAPLPMIGIDAHAQIPTFDSLKFYAHMSGLPLGGLGHFYDFEVGLKYYPIEVLAITAGYRRIDISLEHDDDYGDLNLKGAFGGLRYEF